MTKNIISFTFFSIIFAAFMSSNTHAQEYDFEKITKVCNDASKALTREQGQEDRILRGCARICGEAAKGRAKLGQRCIVAYEQAKPIITQSVGEVDVSLSTAAVPPVVEGAAAMDQLTMDLNEKADFCSQITPRQARSLRYERKSNGNINRPSSCVINCRKVMTMSPTENEPEVSIEQRKNATLELCEYDYNAVKQAYELTFGQ